MPSIDLVTTQDLEEKTKHLEELILDISNKLMIPRVLKVNDIARIEGVSKTQILARERYLLPRFGKSGYPDGVIRWDKEEYEEWRKIPPLVRKQMMIDSLNNKHSKNKNKGGSA